MSKPEIRLKGFEGDWSSKPLSDKEFSITAGGDADKNLLLESGKYPVIANALTNDGIIGYYAHSYRIKGPAVTVTGRGEVGFAQARPYSFTPVVRLLAIKSLHNVFFFANAINKNKIVRESTGVPQLTTSQLAEHIVPFPPTLNEEERIGVYFKSYDVMIQATTKKIASLKQIKAASLISMFPQNGETKPRVRFKGFEGEWKKKRLNECLEISNERNFENKYGKEDVLSVSDDYGVMNQIELLGRSYAGKSVSNYGILKNGEIVYTKSPLKSKPFGIVKLNTGKTGIVSVLYAIYRAKEGTVADYIHYYFDPDWRLNDYLRPLVNKGAKNTMNISDEMALTGYIMIPEDIREQQRIASFFASLDKQISLQEQRLEKLKQIKAACLDKMFV